MLAALQETDVQKPAIEQALGNVAACLGLTHEMNDLGRVAPPPMIPMQAGARVSPVPPSLDDGFARSARLP